MTETLPSGLRVEITLPPLAAMLAKGIVPGGAFVPAFVAPCVTVSDHVVTPEDFARFRSDDQEALDALVMRRSEITHWRAFAATPAGLDVSRVARLRGQLPSALCGTTDDVVAFVVDREFLYRLLAPVPEAQPETPDRLRFESDEDGEP